MTGLGVKAPYDEDNEVLARQMHGGVELMGLHRSLLLGTEQGLVPTCKAPCPVEEGGWLWGLIGLGGIWPSPHKSHVSSP